MNDEAYGLPVQWASQKLLQKSLQNNGMKYARKKSHRPQSNDSKLKQMLNLIMSPDYNNKKAWWGS